MEASLQLPIQVSYIVLIGFTDAHWQPSPVLVLSVVASLLSASFNAGMAIMYQSSLRWGFLLNAAGIAGGEDAKTPLDMHRECKYYFIL